MKSGTICQVEIHQVATRSDRDAFLRLPWKIYAGDPLWAPPLLIERKEFINPAKHPFYLHGAATAFLAVCNGEPAGRLIASDDPNYNRLHGSNAACFGMFESTADPAVAHALLDAAAEWARSRGRSSLMGPIDYSTNYACGLLVEGFGTPPRMMMNHNPPYYAELLESWGLRKVKDLYSWWFDDSADMIGKWSRRITRIEERGGFTVRSVRRSDFEQELTRCQQVYNEAWGHNWGFVPMTEAETKHMARQLRMFADFNTLLLAESGGRAVGFSMTLPDLNNVIRPLNGRLFRWGLPIGLVQLLRRSRREKHWRLLVLGVVPEFRRRGIAESLIFRTLEAGYRLNRFGGAELGWTLEDNDLINRAIETVGARLYKRYRIYDKPLAPA